MVRSLKRRCNNYITELEIAIDKIVTPAINTPTKLGIHEKIITPTNINRKIIDNKITEKNKKLRKFFN